MTGHQFQAGKTFWINGEPQVVEEVLSRKDEEGNICKQVSFRNERREYQTKAYTELLLHYVDGSVRFSGPCALPGVRKTELDEAILATESPERIAEARRRARYVEGARNEDGSYKRGQQLEASIELT